MEPMALRVFFILYCLEAGFFFILAPWTRFWLGNPLLTYAPSITAIATNPYFRGLVSGFGFLHLLIGIRDLLDMLQARRDQFSSRGQ